MHLFLFQLCVIKACKMFQVIWVRIIMDPFQAQKHVDYWKTNQMGPILPGIVKQAMGTSTL